MNYHTGYISICWNTTFSLLEYEWRWVAVMAALYSRSRVLPSTSCLFSCTYSFRGCCIRWLKRAESNGGSWMFTFQCDPYHFEDKIIFFGDAAHAMVPFYGQGMNCVSCVENFSFQRETIKNRFIIPSSDIRLLITVTLFPFHFSNNQYKIFSNESWSNCVVIN